MIREPPLRADHQVERRIFHMTSTDLQSKSIVEESPMLISFCRWSHRCVVGLTVILLVGLLAQTKLVAQDYRGFAYDSTLHLGAHIIPSARLAKDSLLLDFGQYYGMDIDHVSTSLVRAMTPGCTVFRTVKSMHTTMVVYMVTTTRNTGSASSIRCRRD